jgi:hypothetical protein
MGVFSWNARNFMAAEKGEKTVRSIPGGFVLWAGGTRFPGDLRSFLSTATGYGTAGVRSGKPFLEVRTRQAARRGLRSKVGLA